MKEGHKRDISFDHQPTRSKIYRCDSDGAAMVAKDINILNCEMKDNKKEQIA